MPAIDFATLERLAEASAKVSSVCSCVVVPLTAWQKLPMTLEPERLEEVATLVEDPYADPTYTEYHPNGTHYDSEDAPIAPRYYPFNRCQVARCMTCGRHYLRYNEAGGYFTELRIRALQPQLLVDAALP
jgi:hypothetical protein